MRVTMQDQAGLLEWAAPRMIGMAAARLPDETIGIGVFDGADSLRAVICMNAFYDHQASIHIASDGGRAWADRKVLALVFSYAFRYRRLLRLEARTSTKNTAATVLMVKLGFKIEGVAKCGAHDGGDAIVGAMLAQDCPWLPSSPME